LLFYNTVSLINYSRQRTLNFSLWYILIYKLCKAIIKCFSSVLLVFKRDPILILFQYWLFTNIADLCKFYVNKLAISESANA